MELTERLGGQPQGEVWSVTESLSLPARKPAAPGQ